MLTLIVILLFIATFIYAYAYKRNSERDSYIILAIICGLLDAFLAVWLFSCINTVATAHTIDEKIEMYQEENANIEESINILVKEYMDFESELYSDLKSESFITLIALYPELKSDELVQEQINIYTRNNAIIKELREEKIDVSKQKFLVYFGK